MAEIKSGTLWIPVEKVAERYGVTKHTVYRWMRSRLDFPQPIKLPSGVLRWKITSLEEWESKPQLPEPAYDFHLGPSQKPRIVK